MYLMLSFYLFFGGILLYDYDMSIRIYNFIKLINDFLLLRVYCVFFNNSPGFLIDILYKDVINNGCFTIKFIQWIMTRYKMMYSPDKIPNWIKLFNKFYEDCPQHEFDYTRQILENHFNTNMESIFDKFDINAISSGSIAQVHKCVYKGKECVLKVVHPNIKESTYIPLFILNLIQIISSSWLLKKLNLNIMSIDLNYFRDSLSEQLYLNIEGENMKKIKEHYKEDSEYIVIPECYYYTDKFIIMSYEEGEYLDNIQETPFIKYKVVLCLNLLLRSMALIYGVVHADLHCANWKVRKIPNKQDYQIVLYDFGLVIHPDIKMISEFIIAWEQSMHTKIGSVISDFIINVEDKKVLKELTKDLEKEILKWTLKPISMNTILNLICNWGREHNIIFNSNFLNLVIIMSLVENDLKKVGIIHGGRVDDYNQLNECFLKIEYLNYINFCQTKNIFKPLVKFMENVLKSENIKFDNLFFQLEYKLKQNGLDIKDTPKTIVETLEI